MFHVSGDVGETEVATCVVVCEAFVVESKKVKHCGVKVVHVEAISDRGVAHFIRCSVGVAGFGSTTSEPGGKAAGVMVTTVLALRKWCTSEFSAPPNKGVLKKTTLFEVLQESGDWLVGGVSVDLVLGHVGMLIPTWVNRFVGVVDLNETDSAFGEAAGHEALTPVVVGRCFADTIHRFGGFGFFREIENVRGIHLHAEGEVEGVDGGVEVLVVFRLGLLSVELLKEVELLRLGIQREVRIVEVPDGGFGSGESGAANTGPLMNGGKERVGIVARAAFAG